MSKSQRSSYDYQTPFKYVNPIRKPNGELRNWEEYDKLSRIENSLDESRFKFSNCEIDRLIEEKHIFLSKEDENRGKF